MRKIINSAENFVNLKNINLQSDGPLFIGVSLKKEFLNRGILSKHIIVSGAIKKTFLVVDLNGLSVASDYTLDALIDKLLKDESVEGVFLFNTPREQMKWLMEE